MFFPSFLLSSSSPTTTSSLHSECHDDAAQDDLVVTGARYYQELSICLAMSESCGFYLFEMLSVVLMMDVVYTLAFYIGFTSVQRVSSVLFFVLNLYLLLQICIVTASCNECGHVVAKELSNYIYSRCNQSDLEAGESKKAIELLGCISQSKLEIRFFGGFALRSGTVLAVLGSVIGAFIPAFLR